MGNYIVFNSLLRMNPGVVNIVVDASSRNRADLASTVISQIPETRCQHRYINF